MKFFGKNVLISFNKKSIGPVVAVSLLLVVSITSVIMSQGWFQTFQSAMFADMEKANINSIDILELNENNIFVKNSNSQNVSFSEIKISSQSCSINGTLLANQINKISLNNCTSEMSDGPKTVVLITDMEVYTKTLMLKLIPEVIIPLDCSTIPYGDWILVPGNPTLGTNDFCVMKYEAKATTSSETNLFNSGNMYCGDGTDGGGGTRCPIDGSVNVTSKASERPLTQVYQTEARELCANLGPGYSLITDPQWVTIARNAENVSSNWADNTIGSTVASGGGLKRGNVGVADSASYNGANPESGIGRDTKALLNLSNGEEIWDISGNIWEWTNDTFNTNTESALGLSSIGYDEWTSISGYDYLEPFNSFLNADYGVGRVYVDTNNATPSGTVHAFLRGGYHGLLDFGGAFGLYLGYAPLYSTTFIGFRCSYTP